MKNLSKNFTFPYKTGILILSAVMIFLPIFILGPFGHKIITETNQDSHKFILRVIIGIPTFLSAIGFIYCTLGYHFQILRGDELKLRIHLEALNISFTTMLVIMFGLIFVFINFNPTQLNYLLIYLSVIGIIAYVVGVEIVKRKYR
ncbi:MAG: hypothetical protein Q8M94_19600 [Ignavibacteria bacterium]|nr:hypothetical protein [Ignavibacteria bacterium]